MVDRTMSPKVGSTISWYQEKVLKFLEQHPICLVDLILIHQDNCSKYPRTAELLEREGYIDLIARRQRNSALILHPLIVHMFKEGLLPRELPEELKNPKS